MNRHHYAFFRLLSRAMPQRPHDPRALRPDNRFQSAFENYALSLIVWLTAACYFFALIPNAAGAVLALPVTPLLLQIPIYASGLLLGGGREHQAVNSRVLFTLLLAASAYFALSHSWARFVAWPFIGLFAVNAAAAVIVRAVERR